MHQVRLIGLAILAAVVFMTGCDDQKKNQQALLNEENSALRTQLEDQKRATDAAEQRAREEAARAAEAERKLQESMASRGGTGGMGDGDLPGPIEGVDITRQGNMINLSVSGDVLFDSGKATLKNAAKKTLDQVGRVLNGQYRGRPIQVDGHTDTDPIKKSKFKSNYELGLARANAVADYLAEKGVSAGRISVSSYGDTQPKATKASSRRVEISVMANE
jgi:chemotaxis protein MotB